MKCFLRVGNDFLEDATRCSSKRYAIAEFRAIAEELSQFGQEIEASIHYASKRSELQEYPDFVLSLGPRGGVRCSAA